MKRHSVHKPSLNQVESKHIRLIVPHPLSDLNPKRAVKNTKKISGIILLLLSVLLQTKTVFASNYMGFFEKEPEKNFKVALISNETPDESVIYEHIAIDKNIDFSATINEANTIVVHDINLSNHKIELIKDLVFGQGKGLLIISGPNINEATLAQLLDAPINKQSLSKAKQKEINPKKVGGVSIAYDGPYDHPMANVAWKSSVQIYDHSAITFEESDRSLFSTLVRTTQDDISKNKHAAVPMIVEREFGKGKVYLFTPWIKKGNDEQRGKSPWSVLIQVKDDHNYSLYNWSYFNWLLHFMIKDAADHHMPSFEKWDLSPVPKLFHIIVLCAVVAFILLFVCVIFIFVRRYSNKHPELIDQILLPERSDKETKTNKYASWFSKTRLGKLRSTLSERLKHDNDKWETVGFYRPLSAYFLIVIGIFVGFVPLLLVMNIQLTNFIPFPQAVGIQHWVALAFGLAFAVFDLGTSVSMVKYFSEYRVTDPGRAMKFIQFYVWFQLFSGIVQLVLLSVLVALFIPSTDYAFLGWVLILRTLLQFPGFVAIFTNIFMAMQRFDLKLLLIILRAPLAGLVGLVVTLLARWWGLHDPQYGEIFGSAIGAGLSAFVAEWAIIAVSIYFYQKVGYSVKVVFLAHFNWQTVKESLRYGLRILPGQMAPFISLCAEPIILSYYLDNYLEIISMLIAVLWINGVIHRPGESLNHSLLPSISESYSHGYINLSRMYIDQGIKWYLISFLGLFPFFVVFGSDIFMGVVPEQWSRAGELMVLGLLVGFADVFAKMPDATFNAGGKPHFYTYGNLLEHSLRLVIMIYLIPQFGAKGLLYSYIIASIIKGLFVWYMLSRYVFMPKISLVQTIIAPFLSSLILYLIAKSIYVGFGIDSPEEALPWVFAFVFVAPTIFFFNGFLGGFDRASLDEFRHALGFNIITNIFGKIFYYPTEWGYKYSPFKEKFIGVNRELAKKEAEELMKKKVALAHGT